MEEPKRRFPYWLLLCAMLGVIVALLVGFIETVGRRGTLVGQYERVKRGALMGQSDCINTGMSEAEVFAILGPPEEVHHTSDRDAIVHFTGFQFSKDLYIWREGPAVVSVVVRPSGEMQVSADIYPRGGYGWHFRRWAEQARTAIHGPRR